MREAGFSSPPDPETKAKFEEFRYLKNSIGSTGMLAMHPLLRWSSRELWQFHMIEEHQGYLWTIRSATGRRTDRPPELTAGRDRSGRALIASREKEKHISLR